MDKYTTVEVTIEQAAAMRAMLKMEAVARMSEALRDADLNGGDAIQKHGNMLVGVLGAVDMWNALDRPFQAALEAVDDASFVEQKEVALEDKLTVRVYTNAMKLYHLVVRAGLYVNAIDRAKKGEIDKEHAVPLYLMARNRESLLKVFPDPSTVLVASMPANTPAFPVRDGGMVN